MPRSRQRPPRQKSAPDSTIATEPVLEQPPVEEYADSPEHVSDPLGTVAMLLMLLLMLLLVFLVIAIAQSV